MPLAGFARAGCIGDNVGLPSPPAATFAGPRGGCRFLPKGDR